MKVIGITGGVGSGKSRVLSFMEERFQAVICQADHVAWELQEPGQVCYKEIVVHFGTSILNEDMTLNRKALGQIVFHDANELGKLNQIMHPAVKKEIKNRIQQEKEKGTKLFVLEAALLIEEDYGEICDELWYIYSSEPIRRQRLKESRAYSDEKMDAIMATQLPEEVFRKECRRVIDNSGTFEDTCAQLEEAVKENELRRELR